MENDVKNKKVKAWAKAAVVLIVCVAALILAYPAFILGTFFCYPYEKAESEISPDNQYIVIVEQTDGAWPYGPSDVRIRCARRGLRCVGDFEEKYTTKIWDDGGKGLITVKWLSEDTAQVTLDGCEQEPETVTIKISPDGGDCTIVSEISQE